MLDETYLVLLGMLHVAHCDLTWFALHCTHSLNADARDRAEYDESHIVLARHAKQASTISYTRIVLTLHSILPLIPVQV